MPNGSDQVYLVSGSNSGNSQNYLKKAYSSYREDLKTQK